MGDVAILMVCDVCGRRLRDLDEVGEGRHPACAHLAAECEEEIERARQVWRIIEEAIDE